MKTLYPILLAAALTAPGINPDARCAGATAEADCPPVNPTNQVRLNFRGAPLEMVLSHLAQATGYTIVLEATARGSVDAWSNQPLTPEEALDLLDSLLLRNGLAAVRKENTLTIINRDEAKTHAIPVKLGGNPLSIPSNDQIVTQIIPVRFVEVDKLISNLQPLVSTHATITANESANTLVITDTQNGIRRAAEIIHAIDAGAEDFTALRVFRLKNAVPSELVDVLTTLFPDQTQSNNNQAGPQFGGQMGGPPGMGGPGGGPGGFMGGGSSQSAGSGSQRLKTTGKVNAVADDRTSSVVVSAPRDLMAQIESVVDQLDSSPAQKQGVKILQLKNARPQEVLKVLQTVFQKNTTTTQNQNNTSTTTDILESRANNQSQAQQNRSGSGLGSSSFGSGSMSGGSSGSRN